MKETVIKIEYKDYNVEPDQNGWYVFEYKSLADMAEEVPCDVTGPFATKAAASRSVLEASDFKDRREREHKNDDRTPSISATLDAGIPSDNNED
jgi:hypothetical protein